MSLELLMRRVDYTAQKQQAPPSPTQDHRPYHSPLSQVPTESAAGRRDTARVRHCRYVGSHPPLSSEVWAGLRPPRQAQAAERLLMLVLSPVRRPDQWILSPVHRVLGAFSSMALVKVSHLRYERWRNTHLIETQLELFTLRWWGIKEFELALEAAGFGDIISSGSHEHRRAPTREDWMLTFEGRA